MRVHNYELIIMDVTLSKQSGQEVLAAMRELQPMPILMWIKIKKPVGKNYLLAR